MKSITSLLQVVVVFMTMIVFGSNIIPISGQAFFDSCTSDDDCNAPWKCRRMITYYLFSKRCYWNEQPDVPAPAPTADDSPTPAPVEASLKKVLSTCTDDSECEAPLICKTYWLLTYIGITRKRCLISQISKR